MRLSFALAMLAIFTLTLSGFAPQATAEPPTKVYECTTPHGVQHGTNPDGSIDITVSTGNGYCVGPIHVPAQTVSGLPDPCVWIKSDGYSTTEIGVGVGTGTNNDIGFCCGPPPRFSVSERFGFGMQGLTC